MSELTPDQCRAVLEQGEVAYIGVIAGGEPYVTPMSYIMRDGDFAFRTAAGRRADAMRENPLVCVSTSSDRGGYGWNSVVFWGNVRFIDDPQERSDVVAALLAKYHTESVLGSGVPSPMSEERFVAVITPDRLTGRSSGGGLSAPIRPGRL